MKKGIIAMMVVAMMGTTAMAQQEKKSVRSDSVKREHRFDPAEMVKKRTEETAKKYGLNEEQTTKLLELNTKYAKSMRPMPRMRRPNGNMMKKPMGDSIKHQRPTEKPNEGMKERRKKMEEEMTAYNKELQSIMTADQYKSYQADMQKRMLQGGPQRNKKQ